MERTNTHGAGETRGAANEHRTERGLLRPRRSMRLTVCLALAVSAGCADPGFNQMGADETGGATASALVYGEPDLDGHPSVGRAGGRGICGGTLITPQHVLTAAHCVETAVPTHVDFGAEVGDPSLGVPVARCAVHPRYNELVRPWSTVRPALEGVPLEDRCAAFSEPASQITEEMSRYDVAILELARPVPGTAAGASPFVAIDPTPRWSPSDAAESFVAVGYGGGSELNGTRQFVAFSSSVSTDAWLIRSTILRFGDSGGPLMAITEGGPRVLAVATAEEAVRAWPVRGTDSRSSNLGEHS